MPSDTADPGVGPGSAGGASAPTPAVTTPAPTPDPSPPTNPSDALIADLVASLLRHGLTAAAGSLAVAGAIQPDQTAQFVTLGTSIGVWLAGLLWSFAEKWMKAHGVS